MRNERSGFNIMSSGEISKPRGKGLLKAAVYDLTARTIMLRKK